LDRRILYLPIETKARELLGKTFLAGRAAERNWVAIVGPGPELRKYMKQHPPGVFVVASIPEPKAQRLEEIRNSGNHIANLCEESIVYTSGEDYCHRKLSPNTLRSVSRLLVVGLGNAEHVRAYRPEHADKIAITGNPRFDTLLPELRGFHELEAKRIRELYGRFILVNTNFSFANPFDPGEDVVARFMKGGPGADGSKPAYYCGLRDYKIRLMKRLQTLLQELAKAAIADRIIIRPHPVENHDSWRAWAESLPNVEVRYEGNANVWMLAAEAVLHSGCTTGIEGLLLDRPVFSFIPEPNSEFLNQSDGVSPHFASADELLEQLSEFTISDQALAGRHSVRRERLGSLVANVAQPFAADRILDQLEQLDLPQVSLDEAGLCTTPFFGELVHTTRNWLKRETHSLQVTPRQKQKFPGITRGDLCDPLNYWTDTNALRQLPQLARLGDRLWAIH
jgi:surface carbohydrate biosynthesis protein